MHYKTTYTNLTETEKREKAIQDIKDYLGEPAFDSITLAARKEKALSLQGFAMAADLAGIRGYPVEVWYKHIKTEPTGTSLANALAYQQ